MSSKYSVARSWIVLTLSIPTYTCFFVFVEPQSSGTNSTSSPRHSYPESTFCLSTEEQLDTEKTYRLFPIESFCGPADERHPLVQKVSFWNYFHSGSPGKLQSVLEDHFLADFFFLTSTSRSEFTKCLKRHTGENPIAVITPYRLTCNLIYESEYLLG